MIMTNPVASQLHVYSLLLSTRYTPADGPWDEGSRAALAAHVFAQVDKYAPGFSDSIVGEPGALSLQSVHIRQQKASYFTHR